MPSIFDLIASTYDDYNTHDVPASGLKNPVKSEIRALLTAMVTSGTFIDLRSFGDVGQGDDDAPALNAAIAAAIAAGTQNGWIVAPSGLLLLGDEVIPYPGVNIIGAGAGLSPSIPGTVFEPYGAYSGPAFHATLADTVFWHNGSLQNCQVRGFTSHGIQISCPMGESSLIDRVTSQSNGGDGFRFDSGSSNSSTPLMLGRINGSNNGGSGLHFIGQDGTHVQVQYVGGDDNAVALVEIENGDNTTSYHIMGWKAERTASVHGHPKVFRLHNLNGAQVDCGQGRILVGGAPDSSDAIIHQTADAGNTTGYVSALVMSDAGQSGSPTAYAAGYLDELLGQSAPLLEFLRRRFSTIPQWTWSPNYDDHAIRSGQGQKLIGSEGNIAWSQALDAESLGWAGYSLRIECGPLAKGGTQVRATFVAPIGAGERMKLDHAAIGIKNSTYNTVATPVELLFGASSGFDIGEGESITSDWATLTVAEGDKTIVIADFNNALSYGTRGSLTSQNRWYKAASASYSAAAPAGSWTAGAFALAVGEIDVS